MSEDQRPGREGEELKVVDRRRFRSDGDPVDPAEPAPTGPRGEREQAEVRAESPPPAESGAAAELAKLRARIDELTRAYAALVEDNKAFRARLEREQARVLDAERVSVAQALLEALDELERTLAAVSSTGGVKPEPDPALATLLQGVRLTHAGLTKRIADLGATRLDVEGQRFDPRTAEAIDAVPIADPAQDEIVLQEVRPGYRIGDRILRPARVRVGRLARA